MDCELQFLGPRYPASPRAIADIARYQGHISSSAYPVQQVTAGTGGYRPGVVFSTAQVHPDFQQDSYPLYPEPRTMVDRGIEWRRVQLPQPSTSHYQDWEHQSASQSYGATVQQPYPQPSWTWGDVEPLRLPTYVNQNADVNDLPFTTQMAEGSAVTYSERHADSDLVAGYATDKTLQPVQPSNTSIGIRSQKQGRKPRGGQHH